MPRSTSIAQRNDSVEMQPRRKVVGIDARIASYNNSGISRYFWGLLSGLSEITSDFDYRVYFSRKRRFAASTDRRISYRHLFTPPHNRFERYLLPLELERSRCDIFHGMDFYIPNCIHLPQICSVYDLYFLLDPESLAPESYRHYSRICDYAGAAKHIICSSEATKKDLLAHTDTQPSNVSVIYPGVLFEKQGNEAAVLKRYHLEKPYMLFVGTIEPRKNIVRLLQGYKLAKQNSPTKMPQLLLVGRKGYRSTEILAEIEGLGIGSDVYYLGELPDSDVSALYRRALFVVYPSLYEGFGFPLLEAMAAGTPVLSSTTSSIPEVVGEAGYLVEPESVESIALGIQTLACERELREQLIEKGKVRYLTFSVRSAAEQTIDVYRTVLSTL